MESLHEFVVPKNVVQIVGDGVSSMQELVKNTNIPKGVQSFMVTNYSFAKLALGRYITLDMRTGKISIGGKETTLAVPQHLLFEENKTATETNIVRAKVMTVFTPKNPANDERFALAA